MESEPNPSTANHGSSRQSILTSFLSRGSRPRSAMSSPDPNLSNNIQPPLPTAPLNSSSSHRRRPATAHNNSSSNPTTPGAGGVAAITHILRRRRSGPVATPLNLPVTNASPALNAPVHKIRLVPHLDTTRSLHFDPVMRECKEGAPAVRIGRFTDRSGISAPGTTKIAFKSKVVSRGHAEIWCEEGGKFFIKDTCSSSGTFLNHVRLSAPGAESRPFPIKDGDVLQLGVDYQGGTEEIYRCVKIRIELGREWQTGANTFNTNALKQLKALTSNGHSAATNGAGPSSAASAGLSRSPTPDKKSKNKSVIKTPSSPKNTTAGDCCICLFGVGVCQSLFIAPCSHVFHYKCIRPMLLLHHPGFSCPLCRTFADLEEDVEVDPIVEAEKTQADLIDIDGDVEMGSRVEEAGEEEPDEGDEEQSPQTAHRGKRVAPPTTRRPATDETDHEEELAASASRRRSSSRVRRDEEQTVNEDEGRLSARNRIRREPVPSVPPLAGRPSSSASMLAGARTTLVGGPSGMGFTLGTGSGSALSLLAPQATNPVPPHPPPQNLAINGVPPELSLGDTEDEVEQQLLQHDPPATPPPLLTVDTTDHQLSFSVPMNITDDREEVQMDVTPLNTFLGTSVIAGEGSRSGSVEGNGGILGSRESDEADIDLVAQVREEPEDRRKHKQ